jgi:hypothetical protein
LLHIRAFGKSASVAAVKCTPTETVAPAEVVDLTQPEIKGLGYLLTSTINISLMSVQSWLLRFNLSMIFWSVGDDNVSNHVYSDGKCSNLTNELDFIEG